MSIGIDEFMGLESGHKRTVPVDEFMQMGSPEPVVNDSLTTPTINDSLTVDLPGRIDAQTLPWEPRSINESAQQLPDQLYSQQAEMDQASQMRQAGFNEQMGQLQQQQAQAGQQAEANKYHYQTNALAVEDWIASLPDYVPGESGERAFNQRLYQGPRNPMPPQILQAFQQLHPSHQQELWQALQTKLAGSKPTLTAYQSAGVGMGEGYQGIKKAGAGLEELAGPGPVDQKARDQVSWYQQRLAELENEGGFAPGEKEALRLRLQTALEQAKKDLSQQEYRAGGEEMRQSANKELERLQNVQHTGEGEVLREVTAAATQTAPAILTGGVGGIPSLVVTAGLQGAGSAMTATREIMQANGVNPDDHRGRRIAQAIATGLVDAGAMAVGGPGVAGMAKMAASMGLASLANQLTQQAATGQGEIDPGEALKQVITGMVMHYTMRPNETGIREAAEFATGGRYQVGGGGKWNPIRVNGEYVGEGPPPQSWGDYATDWKRKWDASAVNPVTGESYNADTDTYTVNAKPPGGMPEGTANRELRIGEKPLTEYTVSELLDIAASEGIGIPKTLKKSVIVETIERAQRERAPTEPGTAPQQQTPEAQPASPEEAPAPKESGGYEFKPPPSELASRPFKELREYALSIGVSPIKRIGLSKVKLLEMIQQRQADLMESAGPSKPITAIRGSRPGAEGRLLPEPISEGKGYPATGLGEAQEIPQEGGQRALSQRPTEKVGAYGSGNEGAGRPVEGGGMGQRQQGPVPAAEGPFFPQGRRAPQPQEAPDIKLRLDNVEKSKTATTHNYEIIRNGNPVGNIQVTYDSSNGQLFIDDMNAEGGKLTLGRSAIRQVQAQIQRDFPDAKVVEAFRPAFKGQGADPLSRRVTIAADRFKTAPVATEAPQSDLTAPAGSAGETPTKTLEKPVSVPVIAGPVAEAGGAPKPEGYAEAAGVVKETGRANIPLLQRKMGITYREAKELLDSMVANGDAPAQPQKAANEGLKKKFMGIPPRRGMLGLPGGGKPELKDIKGRVIPETDYGYLVDEDGVFHRVGWDEPGSVHLGSHAAVAKRLIGDPAMEPGDALGKLMRQKGYIRVIAKPGDNNLQIQIGGYPALKKLKNLTPLVEDRIAKNGGVLVDMGDIPDRPDHVFIDSLKSWKNFILSEGKSKGNIPGVWYGREGVLRLPWMKDIGSLRAEVRDIRERYARIEHEDSSKLAYGLTLAHQASPQAETMITHFEKQAFGGDEQLRQNFYDLGMNYRGDVLRMQGKPATGVPRLSPQSLQMITSNPRIQRAIDLWNRDIAPVIEDVRVRRGLPMAKQAKQVPFFFNLPSELEPTAADRQAINAGLAFNRPATGEGDYMKDPHGGMVSMLRGHLRTDASQIVRDEIRKLSIDRHTVVDPSGTKNPANFEAAVKGQPFTAAYKGEKVEVAVVDLNKDQVDPMYYPGTHRIWWYPPELHYVPTRVAEAWSNFNKDRTPHDTMIDKIVHGFTRMALIGDFAPHSLRMLAHVAGRLGQSGKATQVAPWLGSIPGTTAKMMQMRGSQIGQVMQILVDRSGSPRGSGYNLRPVKNAILKVLDIPHQLLMNPEYGVDVMARRTVANGFLVEELGPEFMNKIEKQVENHNMSPASAAAAIQSRLKSVGMLALGRRVNSTMGFANRQTRSTVLDNFQRWLPFLSSQSGMIPGEIRKLLTLNLNPRTVVKAVKRGDYLRALMMVAGSLATGAAGTYLMSQGLNKMTTGHSMDENDERHKMDVALGNGWYVSNIDPTFDRASRIMGMKAQANRETNSLPVDVGRELVNEAGSTVNPAFRLMFSLASGHAPYLKEDNQLADLRDGWWWPAGMGKYAVAGLAGPDKEKVQEGMIRDVTQAVTGLRVSKGDNRHYSHAERMITEMLARETRSLSTEERERKQAKHATVEALRRYPDYQFGEETGIPPQEFKQVRIEASLSPIAYKLKHLNYRDSMLAWDRMTPAEKADVQPIMLEKLANPRTIFKSTEERAALIERVQALK